MIRSVLFLSKNVSIKCNFITCHSRHDMNLHFDVSINFYQLYVSAARCDKCTEYFVPNIVKNNSFIVRPVKNSQSKKFKFWSNFTFIYI